MASAARRLLHSGLRTVLAVHALCSVAVLAVLAVSLVMHKRGGGGGTFLKEIGQAVEAGVAGGGGMTLMWITVAMLGAMFAGSLVLGLIYGRWGLPGYLQGRAVFFVPVLAAVYFVVGRLTLDSIATESLATGWRETRPLFMTSAGLTLILLYAAASTSAVGIGWAIALAVARYKRSRGKWETIGYVERA